MKNDQDLKEVKRMIKIDDPLPVLVDKIRGNTFNLEKQKRKFVSFSSFLSNLFQNQLIKKLYLLSLFLSMAVRVVAPDQKALYIHESLPVEPFSRLLYAIGMVETMGNTMAYNEFENAAGIFQIRQVRLDDYNRRTGNNYSLKDMFNYEISEKVFLYFASVIGPYDFERIAKSWNGSGPMTEFYWKKIKKYL